MTRRIVRGLIRCYPRAWRERYGDEMRALLGARPVTLGVVLDLMYGAAGERLRAGWSGTGAGLSLGQSVGIALAVGLIGNALRALVGQPPAGLASDLLVMPFFALSIWLARASYRVIKSRRSRASAPLARFLFFLVVLSGVSANVFEPRDGHRTWGDRVAANSLVTLMTFSALMSLRSITLNGQIKAPPGR